MEVMLVLALRNRVERICMKEIWNWEGDTHEEF